MVEMTAIIDVSDIPEGRVVAVEVNATKYVVCRHADRFFVADILCPHAGGSLAKAEVVDGQLICPVHRWPWDLATGLSDPKLPACRLKLYRTEVHGGQLHADLSKPLPLDLSAL